MKLKQGSCIEEMSTKKEGERKRRKKEKGKQRDGNKRLPIEAVGVNLLKNTLKRRTGNFRAQSIP